MATSSPMNDPAARAGSNIATRPKVRYGGDGTNSTNAEGATRIGGPGRLVSADGSPMPAASPTGIQPPGRTRRDNIIAARADGTFDAKRNAFNAQSHVHGQTMDEAGNLAPVAGTPPATSGSSSAPPSQPGATPPAAKPTAAPAPATAAKPPAAPAPAAPAPAPAPAPAAPAPAAPAPAPAAKPPAAPAPSAPAPAAPAPAAPAPAAPAPAPRAPGMINDGQGFRPASEVNAGIRAAQNARAAPVIATRPTAAPKPASTTPNTAPGILNQAAVDAHWTPERKAASRKEEARLMAEQRRKEAAQEIATNPALKPKAKTDDEYREQHRKRIESYEARKKEAMSTVGTPSSDLDVESVNEQRKHFEQMQKLNGKQKLLLNGNPSPNGFSSFDEAAKSMYGDIVWGKHVGKKTSPSKTFHPKPWPNPSALVAR